MNAVDAFGCEENEAPLCFSHCLPRSVASLQMGGLSLTRRLFNALLCSCSTEDRAVRTWASCSERRICKVKTARGRIRSPVASAQQSRLHFGRSARLAGACRLFRRLERCLPGLCSCDPDARVPPPNLWRGLPALELMPTDYCQNFARYSLADKARRGADSP
jgi:hypothetical protein